MFLRLKFPLTAFLIGFSLLLSGCNEGTNTEPTVTGDTDFTLPPPPEAKLAASDLVGDIEYDFVVAGNAFVSLSINKTRLDSGSFSHVDEGRLISTNLLLGGLNHDDVVSPALVSLIDGVIYLHSRVSGETFELYELPSKVLPCSIAAHAEEDGRRGFVYLTYASATGSCNEAGMGAAVSFSDGEMSLWTSGEPGSLSSVVYSADGKIETLIIDNFDRNAVSLRGLDGTGYFRFSSQYRKPAVQALGTRSESPDNRYLSLLLDGSFYAFPLSSIINSDSFNPQPVLEGLSLNAQLAVPAGPYYQRTALILESDAIYGIDQLSGDITLLAEFSNEVSNDKQLYAAYVVGETLYFFINSEESGEVWSVDVSMSSEPQLVFQASSSLFFAARTNDQIFMNWLEEIQNGEDSEAEPEVALRTIILGDGGNIQLPEGSSRYADSINLARDGDDIKVIAMKSEDFQQGSGLQNPDIWEINPATGQEQRAVRKLYKRCFDIYGETALGNRLSLVLTCNGEERLSLLDTNLGTLNLLVRNY